MASNTAYTTNLYGRNFGGTKETGVADPYISGYGYLWFDNLPAAVKQINSNAQSALAALAYVITPPAITLEKVTIQGVGGTQWSVPTRLNIANEFSVEFVELTGTPISEIINGWVTTIRDYRTGLSNMTTSTTPTIIQNSSNSTYNKSLYSGTMYYWTVDPDGVTIETLWYYTGVFPLSFISSEYVTDVANNGELKLTVNFNVDNIYKYDQNSLMGNTSLSGTVSTLMSNILQYKAYLQSFAPTT